MPKLIKQMQIIVVVAAVSVMAFSCTSTGIDPEQRPTQWAQPVQKQGLPNFHKISDDLYRGAQPDADGIAQLETMGIKTILNLRANHSDSDILGNTQIKYEHIDMQAWDAKEEDTIKFLKIVTDKEKTPVFVHCQRGADRTGYMCAVYRVAVCGWSKEDAIKEMTDGGYNFSPLWQNLKSSVMKMDVEKIREKAGIEKPA